MVLHKNIHNGEYLFGPQRENQVSTVRPSLNKQTNKQATKQIARGIVLCARCNLEHQEEEKAERKTKMEANITNATVVGDVSPLSLDTGSWFVLAATLIVFFGPLFVLFPPFPPRRSDALWQTHTKLGITKPSKSKLRDQAATAVAAAQAEIKSIFVYPVECSSGIEVARAKVVSTGLEYDRLYTLAQLRSPFPVSVQGAVGGEGGDDDATSTTIAAAAKDHKWESITPQQFPRLATLQVELWQPDLDKLKGLNDKNAQSNSEAFLILRFPWREPGFGGLWSLFAAKCLRGWAAVVEKEVLLPVAFPPPEDVATKGYARETVRVRASSEEDNDDDNDDSVAALDMSVELPEELRLYLGVSNKLGLFRADPAARGEIPSAPRALVEEKARHLRIVGFHDSVS